MGIRRGASYPCATRTPLTGSYAISFHHMGGGPPLFWFCPPVCALPKEGEGGPEEKICACKSSPLSFLLFVLQGQWDMKRLKKMEKGVSFPFPFTKFYQPTSRDYHVGKGVALSLIKVRRGWGANSTQSQKAKSWGLKFVTSPEKRVPQRVSLMQWGCPVTRERQCILGPNNHTSSFGFCMICFASRHTHTCW